jgi:hypothetical protein
VPAELLLPALVVFITQIASGGGHIVVTHHQDTDPAFSATAAQRTYSPPLLWRPFRSVRSQDLYLDVFGAVYGLEQVHDAGSVSIPREEEERLEAACW